jgi:hypothetical protein
VAWLDALMGLMGPDDALRFGLGQRPGQPGGAGPQPLMSGLDSGAAASIPMPSVQGPLSAIPLAPRTKPRIKQKGASYGMV